MRSLWLRLHEATSALHHTLYAGAKLSHSIWGHNRQEGIEIQVTTNMRKCWTGSWANSIPLSFRRRKSTVEPHLDEPDGTAGNEQ